MTQDQPTTPAPEWRCGTCENFYPFNHDPSTGLCAWFSGEPYAAVSPDAPWDTPLNLVTQDSGRSCPMWETRTDD